MSTIESAARGIGLTTSANGNEQPGTAPRTTSGVAAAAAVPPARGEGHEPKPLWEVLAEEYAALGGNLDGFQPWWSTPVNDESDAAILERHREEDRRNLPGLYRLFHARAMGDPSAGVTRPTRRTALCFSGGGIRSATFNLGVLQCLAELGAVQRFDYLSTVSGGGYLGGWLSGWARRATGGLPEVVESLKPPRPRDASTPTARPDGFVRGPVDPEPPPLRHLRTYSRYLSPTVGAFSADTWTLATIYLRNLLLNWLVLVPLLFAVMTVPRFCVAFVAQDPVSGMTLLGLRPGTWLGMLLVVGVSAAMYAFGYAGRNQPSARRHPLRADERVPQHAPSRGQIRFLLHCWLPMLLSAVALSTYWAWASDQCDLHTAGLWMVLLGVVLGGIGWVMFALTVGGLTRWRELVAGLVGGAVAGLGLWGSAALLDTYAPRCDAAAVGATQAGLSYARYVLLGFPLVLSSLGLGGTLYLGFTSHGGTSTDEDREWWARAGAWVLIATLGWVGLAALVLFGPAALLTGTAGAKVVWATVGSVSGAVTIVLGRSSATSAGQGKSSQGGRAGKAKRWALALAAPLFVAFLVAGASLATSGLLALCRPQISLSMPADHYHILGESSPWLLGGWASALTVFGIVMSRFINLNKFSLHGMYRDRLIRAYLGASRGDRRRPDPFTGFDPTDNIQMYALRPELLQPEDVRRDGKFLGRLVAAAAVTTGDGGKRPADPDPASPDARRNAVADFLVSRMSRTARTELAALADQFRACPTGQCDGTTPDVRMPLHEGMAILSGLNDVLLTTDLARAPQLAAYFPNAPAADPMRPGRRLSVLNRQLLDETFAGEVRPYKPWRKDNPASIAPLHVVNVALNLVSGDDPAWQERKADSMTVSALHAGSGRLGYRDARQYGGDDGISLGTAVTISGAAVSPNMGYHSSRPIAFLLTLFNVRLGWWLGNPGPAGADTFKLSKPLLNVTPVVYEAFGLTDAGHKHVYLSDGGHFDNLGLYEMVRRRCHVIVVGDAGADPVCAFDDLGKVIRRVRIDMGVRITFPDGIQIVPRDTADCADKGRYCAVGRIDYTSVDGEDAEDGWLLYLKPAFYGKAGAEPEDVYNYAKESGDFPHESTADQFFSESQFESYRALGYHAMARIAGRAKQPIEDLGELIESARVYVREGPAA